MKKLTLPIIGTLALSLACSSVFAVDGTITVNGVITDGTCTLQAERGGASGLKDLTVNLSAKPKSHFASYFSWSELFDLYLTNAAGTGPCDAATSKAFKGIHLSAISPDDLDAEDKTLLVNRAVGAASTTNPIFIRFDTSDSVPVDLSAPWGKQWLSPVLTMAGKTYVSYFVGYVSKTGIVDAQNVNAKINYTLHYN